MARILVFPQPSSEAVTTKRTEVYMHKVVVAGALLFLIGGCGSDSPGSEAFCDATRAIANAGETSSVPPEVNTLVDEAPDEIKEAAETVRSGFEEAFENQDPAALQSQEFTDAATEVREYALENCEGLTDES